MATISWDAATWLNCPPEVRADGPDLLVTTADKTDFWRTTGYGYVTDNGHALLAGFPVGSHAEVGFVADFTDLYDQAGLMVRINRNTWLKAGTEFNEGVPQLSTVVTHGVSDWSQTAVPEWAGQSVTLRVSREGDALTVRARAGDEPWRMIRLAPLDPAAVATVGPYCCSPTRAGLTVRFTRFDVQVPDDDADADNT